MILAKGSCCFSRFIRLRPIRSSHVVRTDGEFLPSGTRENLSMEFQNFSKGAQNSPKFFSSGGKESPRKVSSEGLLQKSL